MWIKDASGDWINARHVARFIIDEDCIFAVLVGSEEKAVLVQDGFPDSKEAREKLSDLVGYLD